MGQFRNKIASTRLLYTQALSVEMMYRYALIQGFFGIAVGFVGLILFWLAAASTSTSSSRYTASGLIAYFVLTSCHSILHENRISFSLSMAIRMGKMSASLLRPYPFLFTVFAQAMAHATMRLLILTPIFLALFFFVDSLRPVLLTMTWTHLWQFGCAVILSLCAGWTIKVAIGLLAFDMTQTWGPELIFISVFSFASGVAFPVDLVPGWIYAIIEWTPVYYMVGFPALVLLGRLSDVQVMSGFTHGVTVSFTCAVLVYFMWKRGLNKFEAIGI